MTDDLISLRILLVTPSVPERDLLRQSAAMAPIPLEVLEADDAPGALRELARGAIDVAFVDGALPQPERLAIAAAARSCGAPPFLLLLAATHDEAETIATDATCDGAAVKPVGEEEAIAFVQRSIAVRLPSRVLVVDDSATMRSIVRKILAGSRFRMEVAEASEGIAALKQIASGRFDVVILDYNMPGLNGVETLSEIRRLSPQVSVVLMTSAPDQAIADRARAVGAVAFLRKPFYPSDIDTVICGVLGLRAPRRG
jgi:CheY-like chemotaxis protein